MSFNIAPGASLGEAAEIGSEALGLAALPLVPLADALAHLPSMVVSDAVAAAVAEGRRVPWQDVVPAAAALAKGARLRLLTEAGALLAVAPVGAADDPVRTLRVFRGALRDGLATPGATRAP